MSPESQLSVLSLNCWGLNYFSKDRQDRMRAIAHRLITAHANQDKDQGSSRQHPYDIVGLQEVWFHEDYLLIRDIVQKVFPYSRHWSSGVFGSGLAIYSRFPIQGTMLRKFTLSGDPFRILHGDWYDGKACVSATVLHPTFGEIGVFNTHTHAQYEPVGTLDTYLGNRLGQVWEMAGCIKAAMSRGRPAIALGDFNSAPESLMVQLMEKHVGLTDSWEQLHPAPQYTAKDPLPRGLTPEQGHEQLGITCDTPLNSWTSQGWVNAMTRDPIGERLDYIFYDATAMTCDAVSVTMKERVAGIGSGTGLKNMSDHFGVHALFSFNSTEIRASRLQSREGATRSAKEIDLLEEVLLTLQKHASIAQNRIKGGVVFVVVPLLVVIVSLIVGYPQELSPWLVMAWLTTLAIVSCAFAVSVLYCLLYGGETINAYFNFVQEVEAELDLKRISATAGMASPTPFKSNHL